MDPIIDNRPALLPGHEREAQPGMVLWRPDRLAYELDPAQLPSGSAGGMCHRDRKLAALPRFACASAAAHEAKHEVADLHVRDDCVRSCTTGVRASARLLTEAHALLMEIAAADKNGIAIPRGLENVPLIGPLGGRTLAERARYPGASPRLTQADRLGCALGLAQSLAQFMVRHAFIIGFTILMLFSLYQEGESLAEGFARNSSSPHRRAGRRLCRTLQLRPCARVGE